MRPDRIVISPGPCTPKEAGISVEVIKHFAGKLPILGVCLGHQSIGAAFGGEIIVRQGSCTVKLPRFTMTAKQYSRACQTLLRQQDTIPSSLGRRAYQIVLKYCMDRQR